MRLFVLADPDTVLAFGMAGIAGQAVHSAGDLPAALQGLEAVGLVLISETLAAPNRPLLERMLLAPGGLLVLEIPDVRGPKPRPASIERILSFLKV